jgi:hypothetical protein
MARTTAQAARATMVAFGPVLAIVAIQEEHGPTKYGRLLRLYT